MYNYSDTQSVSVRVIQKQDRWCEGISQRRLIKLTWVVQCLSTHWGVGEPGSCHLHQRWGPVLLAWYQVPGVILEIHSPPVQAGRSAKPGSHVGNYGRCCNGVDTHPKKQSQASSSALGPLPTWTMPWKVPLALEGHLFP